MEKKIFIIALVITVIFVLVIYFIIKKSPKFAFLKFSIASYIISFLVVYYLHENPKLMKTSAVSPLDSIKGSSEPEVIFGLNEPPSKVESDIDIDKLLS